MGDSSMGGVAATRTASRWTAHAALGASAGERMAVSRTQLREEDLAQLRSLKSRDTAVRQHEAAHLAAAGGLATSGATFTYQKGPDGVNYAIGGEVSIDTSPGRTPQDTIARARTIRGAALAPADPSSADLAIAAKAQQLEQEGFSELARIESQPDTVSRAKVERAYQASTGIGKLDVFA